MRTVRQKIGVESNTLHWFVQQPQTMGILQIFLFFSGFILKLLKRLMNIQGFLFFVYFSYNGGKIIPKVSVVLQSETQLKMLSRRKDYFFTAVFCTPYFIKQNGMFPFFFYFNNFFMFSDLSYSVQHQILMTLH